jgi:hypothetical protein
MDTVHCPVAAMLLPQVLAVMAKALAFVPVSATLLKASGELLLLDSVAVIAAAVRFGAVLGNTSEVGANVSVGTIVPVPISDTACGEPAALSVNVSEALKLATELGVKLIETAHCAPAERLLPQVLEAMANTPVFAPVIATPLSASAALPLLVNVTGSAVAVVPMMVLGKDSVVADKERPGVCGALGVPDPQPMTRDPEARRRKLARSWRVYTL